MRSFVILVLLALANLAHGNPDRIFDFTLTDYYSGRGHQLQYYKDSPAAVFWVSAIGCDIVEKAAKDYAALANEFRQLGVEFFVLDVSAATDENYVEELRRAIDDDIPLLFDEAALVSEQFGVNTAGTLIVVDPQRSSTVYRGPIQTASQRRNVSSLLTEMILGQSVKFTSINVDGCKVHAEPKPVITPNFYSTRIAPLLLDKCAHCHRDDGIGPWSMSEYIMVNGFSQMIKEVVLNRRMPPWHPESPDAKIEDVGQLNREELRDLVAWIDHGAPRGGGDDPLRAHVHANMDGWPLGKPDLIIRFPSYSIPATGFVQYKFPVVENPLNEEKWIKAATVRPSEPAVLHHMLASIGMTSDNGMVAAGNDLFITYAPGVTDFVAPQNSGVRLPPGAYFHAQIHYTTTGQKLSDTTELGLYFYDDPPDQTLRHYAILDPTIEIKAGAVGHIERGYFQFKRAATLHSLIPHAHYRGMTSKFILRLPDGSEKVLLNIPKWDFNWQRLYKLSPAIALPKDSILIHETEYDNSSRNQANPDPEVDVGWGLYSEDEMLFGIFTYTWDDETMTNDVHDAKEIMVAQIMGYSDADMDGALSDTELPRPFRRMFKVNKLEIDLNGNDKLEFDELKLIWQVDP